MSASVRSRSGTTLGRVLIVAGIMASPWLLPGLVSASSPAQSSTPSQASVTLKPLPDGDYATQSLSLDQITQAVRAAGVADADVASWRASMPTGDEVFILRLKDGRLYGINA